MKTQEINTRENTHGTTSGSKCCMGYAKSLASFGWLRKCLPAASGIGTTGINAALVAAVAFLGAKPSLVNAQTCGSAVGAPTTINGISVTGAGTGSVGEFGSAFLTCGTITLPGGSLYLGATGAFSYTYTFSQPVANLTLMLGATGGVENEVFTFTTNGGGTPQINDMGSCFSSISGNVISSGAGSLISPGGGGLFQISNPTGKFTTLTITGPGGANGSLFALCSNSLDLQPKCTVPSAISISPSSPAAIASGGTRTFSMTGGTVEGGTPSYTWAITPSTGVSPSSGTGTSTGTVTFSTHGTYSVAFTATNTTLPAGCETPGVATASVTQQVNAADTDGDGVPDAADHCPNTPTGGVVNAQGCPNASDLSITKTASVAAITPGVAFDYTITVTNTGSEAHNVKASDIVPAGLTINGTPVASNTGTVSLAGQTVTATWPIVPAGATRTLTISVTKP